MTLGWDSTAGATNYIIERNSNGKWFTVVNTTETSATVTNLRPESTYTFRVRSYTALDSKNVWSSSYSSVVEAATSAYIVPSTMTYLKEMRYTGDGANTYMQTIGGAYYLYLPACSTPDALPLEFVTEGTDGGIVVEGSLGSTTLSANQVVTVDLAALAVPTSNQYSISVAVEGCEPITVNVMRSENIATISLTSQDPEGAGRAFVDASKDNKATGSMVMTGANGEVLYDGALKQIKARGNSTFLYAEKKSYQIKLSAGTDLLDVGEDVGTWVLLAGYNDATLIHDKTFKDLAADMGLAYSMNCDWVDLFYDGEYRGTYLLSEKPAVGEFGVEVHDLEEDYDAANEDYGKNAQTARATNQYGAAYQYVTGLSDPANISGGYLIELNHDYLDEVSGFWTKEQVAFNVKSPEYCSQNAMAYISEYYQEFEDAVYAVDENGTHTGINPVTGKAFDEYCDLDSLVKTYLLQLLALNIDAYASSFFFYKEQDGMMYAGPVWDMEMACGSGWNESIPSNWEFLNNRYLAKELIQIPAFRTALKSYYDSTFAAQVENLISEDVADYEATLSASAAMNNTIWPMIRVGSAEHTNHLWPAGTTYHDVIQDMLRWLTERQARIENNLESIVVEPTPGGEPDTTPGNPGTTPSDPVTTPDGPGTTPSDPGTTPSDPGTTPSDPGTTPSDPGTTPDGPGTTPSDPTEPEPATYTITPSVRGGNGTISPAGAVTVREGERQRFDFTPAGGYRVASVKVDGVNVSASSSYTFENVTADHTIDVVFEVIRTAGGGSSSSSGSSGSTTTETTRNPDGSTTTTTTDKKTGTVTETTKTANGSTGTVVTDKSGTVTEVKATVSNKAVTEAAKTGTAVTLPVEVPTAKSTKDAPVVQVTVPKSAGSVKVEVPVEKVTPGTVAVIVKADGTEKIVSTSMVTKAGIALTLDGSATVKIIENSKSFPDVPKTNVFYNEISSLSAREIMVGKNNGKFELYKTVTLDQISNVAGRIVGAVDVKDFSAGVTWGAERGLQTGNVAATRGDVLKALYIVYSVK